MLIQELFQRAAAARGPVTQDIAATLAPAILRRFAATMALGGSGRRPADTAPDLPAEAVAYTDEELQNFGRKLPDQSLATHLINGLFAGMFLAERLPEHKSLDEHEQRLWALGYTVHDYTKAFGVKIDAGQLPAIRKLIGRLGAQLAFEAFLPSWADDLDDIVFLAQNTQTVQGANLNLRDYQLRLHPRRRETLRMLSSVTDLLVHITAPSDVLHRDARGRDIAYNLRQKLLTLFGAEHAPRLGYHKLLEVRGLLSNLLNNALIDTLRPQGYEPFLFFPEGAIYLAQTDAEALIDPDAITRGVWGRVAELLTGARQAQAEQEDGADDDDGDDGGGLRVKRTKDYLKVPPVFYELLTPQSLMDAGRRTALAIRNSRTISRFGAEQADERGVSLRGLSAKEKDALFVPLGTEWAAAQQLPTDVRVDQLAEYLGFLRRRVFAEIFPALSGATEMLLDALGLKGEIAPERAERQRSGTPTGWFYVAARYIQQHPQIDPSDLEALLRRLAERALEFITAQGQSRSEDSATSRSFQEYARRIIEVDGRLVGADEPDLRASFAGELQRYTQSKAANKAICSLCASADAATDQDVSVVLFKPQQYSNKSPLDRARFLRGICPICALEMMLRQVQQGLPASKTQDQQPINLYLYPTYFFTAETAAVIKTFLGRLQNLNPRRLIFTHLEQRGFSLEGLLDYEDFVIDEPVATGYWKPRYAEDDLAALFFLTFRPLGRKLTDTDTWIVPSFFALALPLLLGVKCVATPSFAPLHNSAADFRETVRLDGPHTFTKYILADESFRGDQLPLLIERLLRVYGLHLDVYAEQDNYHWGQLTNVAKDLATDPLYVFQYFDRRQRGESAGKGSKTKPGAQPQAPAEGSRGVSPRDQQRYLGIYSILVGGDRSMGFIGKLVDAYAQFYRASKLDSAYAVLRPLGTAIDVVVDSEPRTEMDDLVLLVAGAVNDDQERVRGDQAEGFDPITTDKQLGDYPTRLALSRQKIEAFAQLFLDECFAGYCDGDRALLRERTNRIRSAARFYYLTNYGRRQTQDTPTAP